MNSDQTVEGGCLCGAQRYRIAGSIDHVVHCNCDMCRKSTGGTVVTWAAVPRSRFVFTKGEPATYRSSSHAERCFCPACGAQLTFWSERYPESIDVTLGTLDHPEPYAASHHIWTTDRLPSIRIDDHLPAYTEEKPVDGGD